MNKAFSFIIALSLLIIAISSAYYFLYYLPKSKQESLKMQNEATQQRNQQFLLEKQQKAATECQAKRDSDLVAMRPFDNDPKIAQAIKIAESKEWFDSCVYKKLKEWGYIK